MTKRGSTGVELDGRSQTWKDHGKSATQLRKGLGINRECVNKSTQPLVAAKYVQPNLFLGIRFYRFRPFRLAMSFLLFLTLALIWLAVAYGGVVLVTARLPRAWWRTVLRVFLYLALLPAPILDEMIAKPAFETMCREKASDVVIDSQTPRGRTVWFGGSQRSEIKAGRLKVVATKRTYVDASTHEPIYHYYQLRANGGFLMSDVGLSEGGVPLLFDGSCQPKNVEAKERKLELTRTNRPN